MDDNRQCVFKHLSEKTPRRTMTLFLLCFLSLDQPESYASPQVENMKKIIFSFWAMNSEWHSSGTMDSNWPWVEVILRISFSSVGWLIWVYWFQLLKLDRTDGPWWHEVLLEAQVWSGITISWYLSAICVLLTYFFNWLNQALLTHPHAAL